MTPSILPHFVIPEPQNAKTLRSNPTFSNNVTRPSFRVLAAIQLNDELGLKAYEIRDVRSEWLLPLELKAIQPMCADTTPKQTLGIGRIPAKILCSSGELARHHPPLRPLPSREGELPLLVSPEVPGLWFGAATVTAFPAVRS